MNARVVAAQIAFGLFSAVLVAAGAGAFFLATHDGPVWGVAATTATAPSPRGTASSASPTPPSAPTNRTTTTTTTTRRTTTTTTAT